jgi:uncharacterized membrane protein YhaH (DUF805 family)
MEVDMEFDVNKAIAYFQDVITNHFTDFNGRVTRKDYWTYVAVVFVVFILAAIVQGIVGLGVGALIQLALLLPNAGMTARRLQDTGKPGTLVWILMIPVLVTSLVTFLLTMTFGVFGLILFFLPLMGLINLVALAAAVYMIYLCIQPGTAGSNQYGPEPASAT